ncbi:hypothetical protein OG607_00715 [Streptomyces sp. NBC_01537]|uniref:hypothetical protein n=1 Tax=Streptomyces sp. NBC_01537 TaxID=2903896 RepID=UPI00386A5D39
MLRDIPPAVRSGRLIGVLLRAADVFDQADGGVPAETVLHLRVLVDALTAAPE